MLPLPKLLESSAWQVSNGDESILTLFDRKGWLDVGFKCDKGNTGRLLLKEPIPVPDFRFRKSLKKISFSQLGCKEKWLDMQLMGWRE